MFFLKKVFNIPINYTFTAIIIERLYDLIAVLLISLALFLIKYNYLISINFTTIIIFKILLLIGYFIYYSRAVLINGQKIY